MSLGCAWSPYGPIYPVPPDGWRAAASAAVNNPLLVPAVDRDFLWDQLVDTIDDHFQIEREDRVRPVGNVLTEGRIDTYPAVASTLLEPWRRDSTPGFEKLHSTLQTIRRQASVNVTPDQHGYLIHVTVIKELEAVDRPDHATVGASLLRHDGSLEGNRPPFSPAGPTTLGWIPFGRDTQLEQRIVAELRGRLIEFDPPTRLPKVR
jgi:hypothetical protein